ncbi:MAG: dihydrofolate reductase [Candidatus Moranbacteria bacterium]|nr:dihydrofolate reductase [Candidatus Moranbacteria bacterium]
MFKKLVALEPTGMLEYGIRHLQQTAEEVIIYEDVPKTQEDIISRIGDADAILVNYTSTYPKEVLSACPQLKYVGMCCSLYSEESANVDIRYAKTRGITVLGIRDYGDKGVVEYVLYEAIGLLHGYGKFKWADYPHELTDIKVGMVGMGTTGSMIAEAMQLLGADISYFARSIKPEKEARGMHFKPLHELLKESEIICLGLNKNVILLNETEFKIMSGKKMLFNTSIGPGHDIEALKKWLAEDPEHYFFCDTIGAAGSEDVLQFPNAIRKGPPGAGGTTKELERLTDKVLANIDSYLNNA